ncbi:hypothetical protein EV421DRAFT_2024784 [Armillaria borealis]|uniref:Uncharacterized protein n=1 Tax=Armillaria borealis TaxID=47425 RepID=A0AA39MEY8_9AGAR|nr:hypothetical protein EV421DRAFT_2024784 [Armillaria borealis]
MTLSSDSVLSASTIRIPFIEREPITQSRDLLELLLLAVKETLEERFHVAVDDVKIRDCSKGNRLRWWRSARPTLISGIEDGLGWWGRFHSEKGVGQVEEILGVKIGGKFRKSAKGGSYEAMMALAIQASKSQRAHQAFFHVMEENLKFNMASIQDMKRGRLPVVPSLNPKDVVNLSCNSMLALTTGLRSQLLLQPVCLEDSTSSMVTLIPAMSFWLCLFCEYIILPSRTSEFTFIDFHHSGGIHPGLDHV